MPVRVIALFFYDTTFYNIGSNFSYTTLVPNPNCDSLITLKLKFIPSESFFTSSACIGGAITLPTGQSFNNIISPIYDTTLVIHPHGCSTIYYSFVDTFTNITSNTSYVCKGSDFTLPSGNVIYNIQHQIIDTSFYLDANGCPTEHIETINLKFNNQIYINPTFLVCSFFPGATYQWYDCSSGWTLILGETSRFFYPANSGNYGVITRNLGCKDTSQCISFVLNSLSQISDPLFELYPNPVIHWLNLNVQSQKSDFVEGNLEIFNLNGIRVWESTFSQQKDRFEIGFLSSGIYVAKISVNGEMKYRKLVNQ